MRRDPPRVAGWLLRLIPQPHREFVAGDLEEEYAARAALGRARADVWYWRQVLATLPSFANRPITFPALQRRMLAMTSPVGGPTRTPAFGSRLIASKPGRPHGTWGASLTSMVFHVGMLGGLVFSTIKPPPAVPVPNEVKVIEVFADLEEATPPPPPPVESEAPMDVDLSALTPPDVIPPVIPPPGTATIDPDELYKGMIRDLRRDSAATRSNEARPIGEKPSFTPYEVAPKMRNSDEVARALQREYPPLLRDAGVGGRVEVWIYLDEEGRVQNVQINASSRQPSLDEAALRVARIIEFSPAMNRDRFVPVWVSIPITFQVR